MITKSDGRLLFQSHILRLRLHGSETLDPYLFFAALNSGFVSQQIRAYQFTQDIIDTLGTRIKEIKLALPRNPQDRTRISKQIKEIIEQRAKFRLRSASVAAEFAAGYTDDSDHSTSIR